MADQQSSGMPTPEEMAADRYQVVRSAFWDVRILCARVLAYQVVRSAFWWRVKIGDGQQTVGRCYTQAGAERLAAALRTAFLDGAFVVAEMQHYRSAMRELGQLVREQSRSRITPAPHA